MQDTAYIENEYYEKYKNLNIKKGQSFEIIYSIKLPIFKTWQREKLIDKLETNPDIKIIEVSRITEDNKFTITAKLLTNPIFIPVLIGITIMVTSIFAYATIEDVKVVTGGLGGKLLAVAIILIMIAWLFPFIRKLQK